MDTISGDNKERSTVHDSKAPATSGPGAKAAQKEADVEEEVEKSIRVHVMPKKYKTTASPVNGQKTKMIGAVIIGFGVVVMIGLMVAAYMYFIKPQTGPQASQPIVVKKEEPKKEVEVKTPVKEEPKKEEVIEEEPEEEIEIAEATTTKENVFSINKGSGTSTAEQASSTSLLASTTEDSVDESVELIIIAVDSDNDGLFDKEEALLGSNSSSTDSDNDGYDDASEVAGLYNPINTDKLYANQAIGKYDNEYLNYSLLYPKAFKLSVVGDNDSIVFAIGDGSFINLIAQPNTEGMDIISWVKDLLPKSIIKSEDVIKGSGWQGVFHENKRIFYLTDNEYRNVFIFDYSPAQENALEYYNLFKVMITSFEIDASSIVE